MVNVQGNGSKITSAGLSAAADDAGISVQALRAVVQVETNGKPWDAAGRVSMLFEPHKFYAALKGEAGKLATAENQGIAYPVQGAQPYPRDSYPRFLMACAIDEEKACQSASWGLGQILGSNFERAGFDSAVMMVEAFAKSADDQLAGMCAFITDERMGDFLEKEDWAGFARHYNGRNYRTNRYDTKLAAAFKALGGVAGHALPEPVKLLDGEIDPATTTVMVDQPVQAAPTIDVLDAKVPTEVPPVVQGDSPKDDEQDATPAKDAAPVITASGQLKPMPAGDDSVRWVQQRLRDLGYFGVGTVDGLMGKRTEGSILVFRHENGLKVTPTIDDELRLKLIDAKPREIAPERANATLATLKPSSSILQATSRAQMAAYGTAAVGGITTFFGSIGDQINTASGQIGAIKGLFENVPGWVWGIAIVLLAVTIYAQAHTIASNRLKMFQTGRAL